MAEFIKEYAKEIEEYLMALLDLILTIFFGPSEEE